MKYVFDIDNTLCFTKDSDYKNSIPNQERIKKVNQLFEEGNYIILCTARGMGRSNNSQMYAIRAFTDQTKKQLNKWGVKYHELHLAKPAGDVYVDDKAIRDVDFFDKPEDLPKDISLEMKHVNKGWGWERWIVNGPEYCGKLLYFNKGQRCSWHHHVSKDEVFYLQSGKLLVKYSEDDNLETANVLTMTPGMNFHVYRGLRHQMIALEDSELFEFSTTHFDSDSYRIVKGD